MSFVQAQQQSCFLHAPDAQHRVKAAGRKVHHGPGLPGCSARTPAPDSAVLGLKWSVGTSGMGSSQPWDVARSVPTYRE